MKHVTIIIPNGHFSLVNVEGILQILSWVNEYYRESGREPVFDIHLAGLQKHITQPNRLFTINPELLIGEVKQTDIIVIPAIHGDNAENLKANAELLPWLKKRYNSGAEIVSLCIASFFLASTGLLDGRECSTHWQFANDFRKLFPLAELRDDKIITEADGIYTSGGAYSFTNLLVYLIEKYAGRETAILAAKAFMIDIDRNLQSAFIIFSGQKHHADETILKAQEYIENNYGEKFSVSKLAEKFGTGRRTFERRFKKATSNTVLEYIQRVKVEAAKQILEKGIKSVNEVMYSVGYNDTNAFRDLFKRVTGLSPVSYRDKYRKMDYYTA